MAGWIKDFRKEIESDVWMMPPLYHRVWQYLKYMVNHAPNKIPMRDGTTFTIDRGQHLTSMRSIAKGIGWYEGLKWKEPNPKTIKAVLDWMTKQGMIQIDSGKGNSQYTLVTIVNWALYQSEIVEGNSKVTVEKQSMDTNKNDKECLKNDKDIYNVILDEVGTDKLDSTDKKDSTPKSEVIVLTKLEEEFINILSKIENYPLDRKKDLEFFKTLSDRYPELDLIASIKDWAVYKSDKPLKVKDNPRSQINTSFKKYVEWGKNKKGVGSNDNRGYDGNDEYDWEEINKKFLYNGGK